MSSNSTNNANSSQPALYKAANTIKKDSRIELFPNSARESKHHHRQKGVYRFHRGNGTKSHTKEESRIPIHKRNKKSKQIIDSSSSKQQREWIWATTYRSGRYQRSRMRGSRARRTPSSGWRSVSSRWRGIERRRGEERGGEDAKQRCGLLGIRFESDGELRVLGSNVEHFH